MACDASDKRTGAVLTYGPTRETARPVAFDSMQLKDAELNYPVHEKELLAIIRALKKWRCELLGEQFTVFTNHKTLENFETQKDLSRRQARWQELLSQYDCKIVYIRGEDNGAADALSRLPCESELVSCLAHAPVQQLSSLRIATDPAWLERVKQGYLMDPWCQRLEKATSFNGIRKENGLWYVGSRLVIPRVPDLREGLFRIAHDSRGHFGFDKSYAALRESFYWPNMRKELEELYIPSCEACQRNKSTTSSPPGPLHPLPVPEARGDCIAIDFIGPLPEEHGFNCIATFTDQLGADLRIVPTRTDLTPAAFATLFFNTWYCENGLPLEIVSDRDHLFVSKFWSSLHKLTGVKLKMSSAFHPETDGASERTNKTVIQAIRYHIERNQKGWTKALPQVRFDIMNSVNASTGFTPFQLHIGRHPRLIPPLVPTSPTSPSDAANDATTFLQTLRTNVATAQDNLTAAKIAQTASANAHRREEV